jgi:putative tryptophan/tyrosine transport system substrate-binding protein
MTGSTKKWLTFAPLLLVCVSALCFGAAAGSERDGYTISVSQYIQHPALDALLRGFMEQMQDSGIRVQYNVHIANGDAALNEQVAKRISAENPNLVLAISTPSAQACLKNLPDKTILFSAVTDPVAAGLVEGLDKPGSRVTGMTDMSPIERQLKLMMVLLPNLKTIGLIYNPNESNSVSLVNIMEQECARRNIKLVKKTVATAEAVGSAAESLVHSCEAVYVPTDNTVVAAIEAAARVCGKNRLPLFAADVDSVPRGAIATLAIDYYGMGRQTARMAERLLRGEAAASMPVESLQDLRIHVNTRAAEVMGVELPVDLLQSADVIYDSFPQW